MTFYAVICGLLSVAAPSLGRPGLRMAIGAIVGIIAAALLPSFRALTGL